MGCSNLSYLFNFQRFVGCQLQNSASSSAISKLCNSQIISQLTTKIMTNSQLSVKPALSRPSVQALIGPDGDEII